MQIPFDNSYARLGETFSDRQAPVPVNAPELIRVNNDLASKLGIDIEWLKSDTALQVLAGNELAEGSTPIASVYAGHQFGNWNPQLGDGRAVLLGEVTTETGARFDIQLKGSGPTRFSRGGDGRAPLGPVIREYLISEAMFALGVPTSRSLAAVLSGEEVMRDTVEPGAVLTRVASSHIRFGTFQYFVSRGDWNSVRTLADHVLQRHYPDLTDEPQPYLALFKAIIHKTAELVARWQAIGFIHGVMNTDNMLLCGETIDYGPCAFMDTYHPETVFSSIDVGGRYAYQNQPGIAHWNLAALAQCFTQLIAEDEETGVAQVREALDQFPEIFYAQHRTLMVHKLGFTEATDATDELARNLLTQMTESELDFTNTFTLLRRFLEGEAKIPEELTTWSRTWISELHNKDAAAAQMIKSNPVIIPRNHLVAKAIDLASAGDFSFFFEFTETLTQPFDPRWIDSEFARPPAEDEKVLRTFCGT